MLSLFDIFYDAFVHFREKYCHHRLTTEILQIVDESVAPVLLSNLGGALSRRARQALHQRKEKLLAFLQKSRRRNLFSEIWCNLVRPFSKL